VTAGIRKKQKKNGRMCQHMEKLQKDISLSKIMAARPGSRISGLKNYKEIFPFFVQVYKRFVSAGFVA
jgi:hypothetical protein